MSIIHTFLGEIFVKISITELYLKMVGILFFYSVPKKMVRYSNYVSKFPTHIRVENTLFLD